MQTRAVIFDFFGVICSPIAPPWFGKRFSADEAVVLKEKYAQPADLGEVTEAEFFQQLSGLASQDAGQVRGEWLGLVSIDREVIALIKALENKYKIGLCSNAPTPFLREILEKNNLASLFDAVIISSEVHLIKPEAAIFELTLDRLGVAKGEAVFIDDDQRNVNNAEAFGIKSFLFSDCGKLQDDLKLHGLL